MAESEADTGQLFVQGHHAKRLQIEEPKRCHFFRKRTASLTATIAAMRPVDDNAAMTVLRAIQNLVRLFHSHCADTDTLELLDHMIDDRGSWLKSRQLFDAIRTKNLKAERRGDRKAAAQYCFEEVCAKTLYNLTKQHAPYDPDTPYWIVPNALGFANEIGLSPNDVVAIIDPTRPS